jgi:CheY-like chemotaxis protein
MFNVAIVDAHEVNRALNVRVLSELKCQITEFSDSSIVLQALSSIDSLDLIFIDGDTPKTGDKEFFDAVKFSFPALPIVITCIDPLPSSEILMRTSHIPYRLCGTLNKDGVQFILDSIARKKS